MARLCFWLVALWSSEPGSHEPSDRIRPAGWTGNYWGPAATRARSAGQLPPLPTDPTMTRWREWGGRVLRDGDIVFRLGDARVVRGIFPLSRYIADASGSPFSHTGIVALEDGTAVVYDCSSVGVRRLPFEVWMLDCVGPMGVKRLKAEHRGQIPGILAYCRSKYEQQMPFDFAFRPDDEALYCLEMTEKAFRSQGLILSQPVPIGNWEHLTSYPLTTLTLLSASKQVLDRPFTLDQPVFLPGNERQGLWASPLLETVYAPQPKRDRKSALAPAQGLSLRGDIEITVFVAGELRRSYAEMPLRWVARWLSRLSSSPGSRTVLGQAASATHRGGRREGLVK
jgi:hypothetical protein